MFTTRKTGGHQVPKLHFVLVGKKCFANVDCHCMQCSESFALAGKAAEKKL